MCATEIQERQTRYVRPERRIDAKAEAPKPYAAMLTFARQAAAGLEQSLALLVWIRASQLNGCSYCTDLHSRDARANGEDERRLFTIAAWRESPLFTARERAALELTESVTLLTQTRVPDDVWAAAEREFAPADLSHLLLAIASINALNRIGVATRMSPAVDA